MTSRADDPIPTDIKLHQRSRALEITFDDGAAFVLPCEYLRVFSPAAEVKAAAARGEYISGKQDVNITVIVPVGGYAVQLVFDDGHDTGVYSWKTLYELGEQQADNWKRYQAQFAGQQTKAAAPATQGPVRVTLLYFATLAQSVGREQETVSLPASVRDVDGLTAWLRKRGDKWAGAIDRFPLKITVNKQFAEGHTILTDGDEIALVSARPR